MKIRKEDFTQMVRNSIEEFLGSSVDQETRDILARMGDHDIVPQRELSRTELRKYVSVLGDFLQMIQRDRKKSEEFMKTPVGQALFPVKERELEEILTGDFQRDIMAKIKKKVLKPGDILATIKSIANNPLYSRELAGLMGSEIDKFRDAAPDSPEGDPTTEPAPDVQPDVSPADVSPPDVTPDDILRQKASQDFDPQLDIEKMKEIVKKRFVNLSDSALDQIGKEINITLDKVQSAIAKRTSGLDIGDDHRLAKAVAKDRIEVEEYTGKMLARLEQAFKDALTEPKYGSDIPQPMQEKSALQEVRRVLKKFENKLLKENRTVRVVING